MKNLLTLALAGALIAPAAAAQAQSLTTSPTVKSADLMSPYRPIRPRFVHKLPRRCRMPRLSLRREWVKLHWAGYKKIKYLGRKTFLPRCAQFLYFSACKGPFRYRVIVRYIKFTRYVISVKQGYCFFTPALRPKYRTPGS